MRYRIHSAALLATVAALAIGCSSHESISLPPRVSGQLPADFGSDDARGVVLARVSVVTEGQPCFSSIANPLVLQFLTADLPDGAARTVAMMNQDAYIFTPSRSQVPSVWRYVSPGLLAMSIAPGTYDGLAIAYPDYGHDAATPSSIPAPSRSFVFTPIAIRPGAIVYVGDVEIRQRYGFTDVLLDRVDVSYSVRDDFDDTVADFRARYPQLAEVAVERRPLESADR